MIGIDIDDLDLAEIHAERAAALYGQLGDPWGELETTLLTCQIALVRGDLDLANALLQDASEMHVEEAEPKQHYLLTLAWSHAASGSMDDGEEALEQAAEVFAERSRGGDHAPHLLGRLARMPWAGHVQMRIESWRALLTDRARRDLD